MLKLDIDSQPDLQPSGLADVQERMFLKLRFATDSPLEGDGFELSVPRQLRPPQRPLNHLSSHHLPRQLGLRFAPKASTPSRKSSDLRRPVFKIEPKPRRQLHDPLLPAKRRTGQVVLGIDRFTSHAAQMDLPRSGPEEVFPRHRGEGRLDPRVPDAKCHFLRQA